MEHIDCIQQFLKALHTHNSIDWMHAHAKEKQQATTAFYALVRDLQLAISAFDDTIIIREPKEISWKLNRDIRFSKDKSPYQTSMRAHISAGGKLPIPVGYFLVISTDSIMVGGGLFADMFQDATKRIQVYVAVHGEELIQILEEPTFAKRFTLQGTMLKRVPKPFDETHPYKDLLRYKSMYIEYVFQEVCEADYIKEILDCCLLMKPFNDFLNKALAGFQMPTR